MIFRERARARARARIRWEMKYFDHERLDVYKAAITVVVLVEEVVNQFPRGRAYLADQLQRAGTSIPLIVD